MKGLTIPQNRTLFDDHALMGKWSKKMPIVMFLMRTTELYLKSQHVYYMVAGNGIMSSKYVDDSATNHEEADSLVIYCLVNAAEQIVDKAVTVYCSETDVFMLLLNLCNIVPCKISAPAENFVNITETRNGLL